MPIPAESIRPDTTPYSLSPGAARLPHDRGSQPATQRSVRHAGRFLANEAGEAFVLIGELRHQDRAFLALRASRLRQLPGEIDLASAFGPTQLDAAFGILNELRARTGGEKEQTAAGGSGPSRTSRNRFAVRRHDRFPME